VALLAWPAAICLASLGLIEGCVRMRTRHVDSLRVFVRSAQQHDDFRDRRRVSIYRGDPLLLWRLKPSLRDVVWDFTLVSTSAQGLRYPRSLGRKPAGTLRVVCLGDSVTFGFRVPVVLDASRPDSYDREALPYPMLLERWLQAANPGRAIEVVPLAVPGYTSHQGLAWLQRDVEWLRPDVVTLCFGWNDVSLRPSCDADSMPLDWMHVWSRRVAANSQALLRFSLWLRSRTAGTAREQLVPRVACPQYVGNMMSAVEVARRAGAQAIVIGAVYQRADLNPPEAERMAGYRQALRARCAATGVPYLQVAELTEAGYPGNTYLFGEVIHPSDRGHRVLAAALLRVLGRLGSLPGVLLPAGQRP
jgi:lysophospholipase L1-like esterase